MKHLKVDASIICFAIVIMTAIPVATLRSRTYSLGYELGHLKQQEKLLRQKHADLKSTLASTRKQIRDKYTKKEFKASMPELSLPSNSRILLNKEE